MKFLLLITAMANYFSFFCSVIGIFRDYKDVQTFHYRLLALNTVALWLSGPYMIWTAEPHWGFWLIMVIQVVCFVGFWTTSQIVRKNQFTAVYSKDTPVTLVRSGPYSYVRHPFYVIYMSCYASVAFTQFSLCYSALVVSIISIYVHAARAEEAKFTSSDLGQEHREYRAQTGMFFPKLMRRFSSLR